MTIRNDSPLLPRGEFDTADTFAVKVGTEAVFEDLNYANTASSVSARLTAHTVRCRLVKNTSGIALLPGRLAVFKAGTNQTEVDGYCATTGRAPVVGVDEYLLAAGVPNNAYFWVVVEGPFAALTSLSGDATNVITEGNPVVALTAATSQATTAGRVAEISTVAASTHTGTELLGVMGRALSARTTANTNASVRIMIKPLGW